ncbi:type II secretion system protein GspJ [Roseivivax sediminis]|uniref:Type II secretion system protein J n=1 Tax=Roseivivax sediminis TaxID=936889 RepID=A0A1I2AC34_9RHOB|nr:type II secretion system protein GspJ [Roseivivax sediminis]SFE41098.1 type II secretion system protein J [Roseivivax sediminis]
MSRARGLSLIELVVALAVFALVATMGLQALTGTLRVRDRLHAQAEAAEDLGVALSLLRSDLSALVPMIDRPGDGRSGSALAADGARGIAMSLAGQARIGGGAGPGLARATWRIEGDMLTRSLRPTLSPSGGGASPGMAVLGGVTALEVRTHWPDLGWIRGTQPRTAATPATRETDADSGPVVREQYSGALPEAVEVTLVTRDHGRIALVESLR